MHHTEQITETNQQQVSHMLVISHNKEEFRLLSDILQHYFPHVNVDNNNEQQQEQQQNINEKDNNNNNNDKDNDRLLIKNKYYKAEVKMSNMLWQETELWRYNVIIEEEGHEQQYNKKEERNEQKDQQQEKEQEQTLSEVSSSETPPNIQELKKYDLMIMLITETQQEQIDLSSLDTLIETVNPDDFVLLINTKEVENQWKYEELIMEKCNNFIEIVKEDLVVVKKNKPLWSRGALLNNEDEENIETGVFSVLDRMETTRWSNMVDIKHEQSKKNKKNKINDGDNTDIKKDLQEELKLNKEEEKLLVVEETNREEEKSKLIVDDDEEKNKNTETSTEIKNRKEQKQFIASLESSEDEEEQHNQEPINNTKHEQQEEQHEEKEVDEEKLEEEMLKFEEMMSQMMSFKIQSEQMSNNERKQKAEQLFSKMFSNFMN